MGGNTRKSTGDDELDLIVGAGEHAGKSDLDRGLEILEKGGGGTKEDRADVIVGYGETHGKINKG